MSFFVEVWLPRFRGAGVAGVGFRLVRSGQAIRWSLPHSGFLRGQRGIIGIYVRGRATTQEGKKLVWALFRGLRRTGLGRSCRFLVLVHVCSILSSARPFAAGPTVVSLSPEDAHLGAPSGFLLRFLGLLRRWFVGFGGPARRDGDQEMAFLGGSFLRGGGARGWVSGGGHRVRRCDGGGILDLGRTGGSILLGRLFW